MAGSGSASPLNCAPIGRSAELSEMPARDPSRRGVGVRRPGSAANRTAAAGRLSITTAAARAGQRDEPGPERAAGHDRRQAGRPPSWGCPCSLCMPGSDDRWGGPACSAASSSRSAAGGATGCSCSSGRCSRMPATTAAGRSPKCIQPSTAGRVSSPPPRRSPDAVHPATTSRAKNSTRGRSPTSGNQPGRTRHTGARPVEVLGGSLRRVR